SRTARRLPPRSHGRRGGVPVKLQANSYPGTGSRNRKKKPGRPCCEAAKRKKRKEGVDFYPDSKAAGRLPSSRGRLREEAEQTPKQKRKRPGKTPPCPRPRPRRGAPEVTNYFLE